MELYWKGSASRLNANCKGNCCPDASWCHLQGECKCPNADCKCWFSGGLDGVAPLVGASPPPLSWLSSLCQGSNLPALSKVASVHPVPIPGIVMALWAHFTLSLKCNFTFLYFCICPACCLSKVASVYHLLARFPDRHDWHECTSQVGRRTWH